MINGTLRTNFSEILIKIQYFQNNFHTKFNLKIVCKLTVTLSQPQCIKELQQWLPFSDLLSTCYWKGKCQRFNKYAFIGWQCPFYFELMSWNYLSSHWRSGGSFNTLRARQNGGHFPDAFKCIFLNENVWISIKISLKFVPWGPINNIPAFVKIMAWCRPGKKPLSEPMMVGLPTHICVTRPQWVKSSELFSITFTFSSSWCWLWRISKFHGTCRTW